MTGLLYDLIYMIPVTVTVTSFYCGLSGNENSALTFAVILIPAVFLTLLTHLKLKERLLLVGITAAGFAGIFIVYRRFADQASPADLRRILPLLIISFACYAAGILMTRFSIAKLLVSLISLILLILTLNAFIRPLTPGIFSAMFLIIISTADEIQLRWKKDGFTDKKTHLVCTAPFIALIIITASLPDYPENPYDWRAFIAIRDSIVKTADRIAYSFGKGSDVITGFSDDGYLLTGLGSSGREELIVTTRSDIDAPIYLTGTVSDSFDGRGWTQKDDSGIPERTFDVLESISSVKSYSDLLRDYYREADISVEYTELKTRYLLAPSKLTSKSGLSGRASVKEEGGALSFRRYNPYHLSLNESYLIANTDNPAFHAFMQSNAAPDEKDWNEALNMIKAGSRDKELSYDKYREYRAWIKKAYSEDISLSPELKEKTDALYAGAQSSYEKLKRLESAFGQMEYTLDPPPIPDDVDTPSEYLDHFLLEEGGGYCSYYATAFALLARAEGLPARYVQGYRVPVKKKGAYTVTSDMAHAWPEVYFEGKGWIAFEPTPGFYSGSLWKTQSDSEADTSPAMSEPYVFEPPITQPEPGDFPEDTEVRHHISAYAILLPISLISVFFILFLLISRLVQRRLISRLDEEAKLRHLAKESLSILRLLGTGIRGGETLSEYKKRITPDIGSDALAFITGYEELLYSDSGKAHEFSDDFSQSREKLLNLLKKRNRLRYILKMLQ